MGSWEWMVPLCVILRSLLSSRRGRTSSLKSLSLKKLILDRQLLRQDLEDQEDLEQLEDLEVQE